ncbi:hypothetical protein NEOKW01_0475 [Nematocida sp. AWRm80]|nr:hypothetical protein NEOKW01_0475 [Nematocida sp. AWRm80]
MPEFENKHVHAFYSESAREFSGTRFATWPKVAKFYEKYVKETDLILDAGSGNGRNTKYPERTVSIDYSLELLQIGQDIQNGLGYARCDLADTLPFKYNTFDIVISIAVIHHLHTKERRIKAVQEMTSLLKPGGYLMLYVWSESPESKSTKFIGLSSVNNHEIQKEFPNPTSNDVFVGWKSQNTLNRYYHLFKQGELEDLITDLPLTVLDSQKDHGNYFIICQKLFT